MTTPQEDFYEWVNEDWLKNNKIPDDKSSYGTFVVLDEESLKNQNRILEDLKPITHHQKLLSLFWNKTENLHQIENIPLLKSKFIEYEDDLPILLGKYHQIGLNPFFIFGATIDRKNSKMQIATFYLSGMSLPDKDYYLNDKYKDKQDVFKVYLEKLGRLVGEDFSSIYDIQYKFAEHHYTKIEKRDPYKTYHPYSLDQLDYFFKDFLLTVGYEDKGIINIDNPDAYVNLIPYLKGLSKENILSCVKFMFYKNYGKYLSKEIDELNFEYLIKPFSGNQIQPEIWKRRVKLINANLGELVGEEYCKKYFDTKDKALEMIDYILKAFVERIKMLEWMNEITKEKAIEKLLNIRPKIGYPDKIENYENLVFEEEDDLIDILEKIEKWEWNNELNEMYKEVDLEKWEMNPQTVNAYYHPLKCEIVFPAAILQYPFFGGSDEENFGGIGAVIAHELTHALDDKGRQYDKEGNLNDWWQEGDDKGFNEKLKVIVEQFNEEKFYGENIKGELTSGENIADDGGVKIAYQALKNKLGNKFYELKDGYTREQRFFMSWGTIWRNLIREEQAKVLINTDPHSPGKLRVNAILKNCNEFYNAFNIKEGDKMYLEPNKRFKLW